MVGDTGIVTGYRTVTVPVEGGVTTEVSGKEVLTYEKGEDGVRRSTRDIGNDGR